MNTPVNSTSVGRHDITGLILAGGQGKRMGGCDKGLQAFGEHCLALHVLQRLRSQVGKVLINANQNLAEYERFGYPVWPDIHPEFSGPLAGVQTGLHYANTRYLLTVPCDSPFLPTNLVGDLLKALLEQGADLAIAVTEQTKKNEHGELLIQRQVHPVFCLLNCNLLDHLNQYLGQGGRKFSDWYQDLNVAEVLFQDHKAFRNINTLEQLQAYQPRRVVVTPPPVLIQDSESSHASFTPLCHPHVNLSSAARSLRGQASKDLRLHDYLQQQADYRPQALPIEIAQRILHAQCQPIYGIEQIGLRSALGRVLAQDVLAPRALPSHDNSAMDGFAFAAADLQPQSETALEIIGRALAGHPYLGTVAAGQCVRIMTGAVMPAGCDTVIAQEHVASLSESQIKIAPATLKPGANRRKKGEDIAFGEIAIRKGSCLYPAQLGFLASLGITEVGVHRRLRVAFFSTGDELRPLGNELEAGCLYDSNRYSLFGMLTRLDCEVHDLGIVKDQPEAISQALANAAREADVVLTSGGMAGGDADYTRRIMQEMGDVHFWQLKMRPGRPFAFGRLVQQGHQAMLFGLPGNPVALMVSFYMLVRPALLQMMGRQDCTLPQMQVASAHAIKKMPGRAEFQRGIIAQGADGQLKVSLTGAQGSAMLHSMSAANCLIALPTEAGDIAAGQMVPVLLLNGLQ